MGLNTGLVVVGADRRRPAHGLHRAGATPRTSRPGWSRRRPGRSVLGRHPRAGDAATSPRPTGAHSLRQGQSRAGAGLRGPATPGRLRTRLEVAAERGLTPFVGREHELRRCRSAGAAPRAATARWSSSWARRASANPGYSWSSAAASPGSAVPGCAAAVSPTGTGWRITPIIDLLHQFPSQEGGRRQHDHARRLTRA